MLKDSFIEANLRSLDLLKQAVSGIAMVVGCVDRNPGKGRPLYNACALINNGKIEGKQYKTLLPTYDVFDEIAILNQLILMANLWLKILAWAYPSAKIFGIMPKKICLVAIALTNEKLAAQGPQVIVNISASPYEMGKYNVRQELLKHHALTYRIPIIFVNQVGGNDQLIFDGRSLVLDAQGNVVAQAAAFAEDLLIVDLPANGENIHGPIHKTDNDPTAKFIPH